jgi:hypothetical protein
MPSSPRDSRRADTAECSEKRDGSTYGADESLHGTARARNHEPHHEGTRSDERRSACFHWPPPPLHRCGPKLRAGAAAIFRRFGRARMRAAAGKCRQRSSHAIWRGNARSASSERGRARRDPPARDRDIEIRSSERSSRSLTGDVVRSRSRVPCCENECEYANNA